MEKGSSSSRTFYNCLSLAEFVGFLVFDMINCLFLRFLKFVSTRSHAKEYLKNDNTTNEPKQELDIVMERIGMPLNKTNDKSFTCFDEVSTIFEEIEPCLEEVKEAFSLFDENGDGFIDAKELQRVLCVLGFKEGEDLEDCQKMIDSHDDDKNGKIDFNEFVRFMETSCC